MRYVKIILTVLFVGILVILVLSIHTKEPLPTVVPKNVPNVPEVTYVSFPKAGLKIALVGEVPQNLLVQSDPHNEWISFGSRPDDVIFLPKFWDITFSDDVSEITISALFTYNPESVSELGGEITDLQVFYYDFTKEGWTAISRNKVDTKASFVSVNLVQSKRYAIGFSKRVVETAGSTQGGTSEGYEEIPSSPQKF